MTFSGQPCRVSTMFGLALNSAIENYRLLLSTILLFTIPVLMIAEGTRELAPNASRDVTDHQTGAVLATTNDIAALNIGNKEYNYFGTARSIKDARLNVYIKNPSQESLYLGFSFGHQNDNNYGTDPVEMRYRFRVYDPSGTEVYVSQIFDKNNATIQDYASAALGPSVFFAGGYDAILLDSDVLTMMNTGNTGEGDYYIEFEIIDDQGQVVTDFGDGTARGDYLLIDYWDITVADNSTGSPVEKRGRVWSKNWGLFAVNDYGFPNREFNGAFYVCAPDPADSEKSYISRIDFNEAGFRPGGFNIAFNSFGIDNMLSFPQSAASYNYPGNDPAEAENRSVPEYEVFLNDPEERCIEAEAGMLALDGITRCDGQASYCIQFMTDKPGEVKLLLDFDGQDELYTPGTRDIEILRQVDGSETGAGICIDWDGRDGLGEFVTGDVYIVLSYEQGRYNFPIYDAEYLEFGFTVESVRPGGNEPLLFYDDRSITDDSGTGSEKDRRTGCSQRCHTWNTFNNPEQTGYGNLNTINTWWFSNRVLEKETVELPAVLSCSVDGPAGICSNEEGTLTLNLTQSPTTSEMPEVTSVEWSGPGITGSSDTEATINAGGTYEVVVNWSSPTGEACFSTCEIDVEQYETQETKIDTTIELNEVYELNGEVYDTTGIYVQNLTTSNGCDSTVTICVTLNIPDVFLECSISGVAGICEGDSTVLLLSTSYTPIDAPEPTINSVTWSGSGILSSNDSEATVAGGDTYAATVNYTNVEGITRETTCEFFVEAFENPEVKIDTIVPFGGSYELNGEVYDSTGIYVQNLTTTNGCDSTVTVCVTVEIPDVVLECLISGVEGICEGDSTVLTLSTSYTPIDAPEPTINSVTWSGSGILSSNDSEATVSGGDTYVATVNYTNVEGLTRESTCEFFVEAFETPEVKIDTIVPFGGSYELNGEVYDATGTYVQNLTTTNGCDSTVTICVTVEIPDVFLTCELDGPAGICENETGIVTLSTAYMPSNAPAPTINSVTWSGSGLITSNDQEATVTGGSTYSVVVNYTNVEGLTRESTCEITVDEYPTYEVTIDTIREFGQTITINGVDYDTDGEYIQPGSTSNGCDSIVIIKITEEKALLCYGLNDCKSVDYARFTPVIAEDFDCGMVTGSPLYRVNPDVNGHSCTEGVNGTDAVCISSVEDCNYSAGDERSAIMDVTIIPAEGKSVRITGIDFYERAPERYSWNVGFEGLNNYPQQYGVRVLKNGVEIYRSEGNETTTDWTLERFSFGGIDEFLIDQPSLIRFELLGYCVVGNESNVTAWDLDEIKIKANCVDGSQNIVDINGTVTNIFGEALENVEITLTSSNPNAKVDQTITDEDGNYAFTDLNGDYDYMISPELNRDFLRGVTTADLIHIQRHILGLDRFDSPYLHIAADVDRSNNITAIDILQLRKLILGIIDEFPSNTSYRFGNSSQELSVTNPWALEEEVMAENINKDVLASFKGIKIGDITTLKANAHNGGAINKSKPSTRLLNIQDSHLSKGQTSVIEISLNDSEAAEGLQFSLDMSNFYTFRVIDNGNSSFYNIDEKNQTLNISWVRSMDGNDNFALEVEVVTSKSGNVSELISMNETNLQALVFEGDELVENPLRLFFENSTLSSDQIEISPNPFADFIEVEYNAASSHDFKLEIFDLSGRKLYTQVQRAEKGYNRVRIDQFNNAEYSGVMILKLSVDGEVSSHRIVKM